MDAREGRVAPLLPSDLAGTALGGILGMLLAVPLTAFFVTAWRLAKQKYFHASD